MAFKNEAERVNEQYSNKGDCLSIDAAGLRMELDNLRLRERILVNMVVIGLGFASILFDT
ncbi:predicted protein [Sclerotinia sclerotiorum 1980 UF-70]|uniref:Uncharacterized protein n=1 Tax=Sclerotinia sclerotiorum (strain ATCC 18683 / 1980 / Ss-1) TaxID=665079 RepID=A7E883_SCLS1|nr:predicted protein [Sclerotinia sclerotiorum 1980 UF-70]EDN96585.1 predicted protein [Sclerotinia sclerotiorum 1980 UF-70]